MSRPFAFMAPAGGGPPPVDFPSTLALTGWWRTPFAGVPWAASASAGASTANGPLVTLGSDPTAGTAQNGKAPAQFTAASTQVVTNGEISTFFTAGAGAVLALVRFDSQIATISADHDPAIFCDGNNGYMGLAINTTGAKAWLYDGGYKIAYSAAPVSTGAYHLLRMRWDGSHVGITVDSLAEVQTAAGNIGSMIGHVAVGRANGGASLDGRILELMTIDSALSDGDYASVKTYVNARYALSL